MGVAEVLSGRLADGGLVIINGGMGQLISLRAAANAATAAWRSARLCAAETCVRIRALPTGTTG